MLSFIRTAAFAVAALVFTVTAASAHPLGNFTVNHLTRITSSEGRLDFAYTVDMAEIPSYSVLRSLDAGAKPDAAKLDTWAATTAAQIGSQMTLSVDGHAVTPALQTSTARTFAGASGLRTIYLQAHYTAAVASGAHQIAYTDGYAKDHIGWRDIVIGGEAEPTSALRVYPAAVIGSPRDRSARSIAMQPDGTLVASTNDVVAPTAAAGPALGKMDAVDAAFKNLLTTGAKNPLVILIALLISIALGALHAFEPGHGKTLLAVSLVGARATVKQAVILASALTIAHTIGVIAIAVVVLFLTRWIVPEAIFPWVQFLSGLFICIIAAQAFAKQIVLRRPRAHVHAHTHDHAHPHDHPHDHALQADHHHGDLDDLEHAKLHQIPGTAPLSFRTAVATAMTGNLIPCPAATIVLLSAITLNRVAFGLLLVVAFGVGLALVLTGVGIAVVRGSALIAANPRFERAAREGPLVTSVVISIIGAVIVAQGFRDLGYFDSVPLVAALILCAIAGYAFTRASHSHGAPAHENHSHEAHA